MLNILFALHAFACTPAQPLGIRFFTIPSASMEPAVHLGSVVAVYRCTYGLSRWSYDFFRLPLVGRWPPGMPARGDIVVFRRPTDPSTFWIKRVIGLPGDRVELRGGRLYLNGIQVRREVHAAVRLRGSQGNVVDFPAFTETLPEGATYPILQSGEGEESVRNLAPVTVPTGRLYLLGDNRDNSVDSRMGDAAGWGYGGTVPVEYVFGSVVAFDGSWPLNTLGSALLRLAEPDRP